MWNLYSRCHWLCVYKVSVLIRFQHVYVSSHDCSHMNEIKWNKINESFRASEKSLTTNDNSLETSLSATKFRWHSCQVPRSFARNIAACGKLSSSRKQQVSRNIVEISLQTKVRLFSSNIRVIRGISFALLLHNTVPETDYSSAKGWILNCSRCI